MDGWMDGWMDVWMDWLMKLAEFSTIFLASINHGCKKRIFEGLFHE
jgi:hypothetical protein